MKRILIVDDEEGLRSTLRVLLERNGYECEEAIDGVQALERLSRQRIDLVITDLTMPNLGGEGLIQRMEDQENWKSIPVICISGNLSLSPNHFKKPVTILEKPINTKFLLTILNNLLKPEKPSPGPTASSGRLGPNKINS